MNRKISFNENSQRYLLLPIETKAREFHAKVLLSCFAAEAGFTVILGGQVELQERMKNLPRGIYIDKSIAPTKIRNFRRCHQLGNQVVAWCEEGLVYRDRDAYLRERVSPEVFKLASLFFSWGSVQADDLKTKLDGTSKKIVLTGNPRFDILRVPFNRIFASEAESISKKFGRFILINTNFSRYNHFHSREYVLETLKKQGKIKTNDDEAFFWEWSNYLGKLYGKFVEMIPALSEAFSDLMIVLRPHPSENHDAYGRATKDLKNVRVIYEGSALPWILASEILVHNSCTTGLEAYLLEKPVVAYCPVTSDIFDSFLPNAVSLKVSDRVELIDILMNMMRDDLQSDVENSRDPEPKVIARRYITNLDGPFAAERIVNTLKNLAEKPTSSLETKTSTNSIPIRATMDDLIASVKRLARKIRMGSSRGVDYQKQKFPGISLGEVENTIEIFNKISNRFYQVKSEKVRGTNSLYWIYKGGNSSSAEEY